MEFFSLGSTLIVRHVIQFKLQILKMEADLKSYIFVTINSVQKNGEKERKERKERKKSQK